MAGFHLFIKTQALKTHIKTKVKSQSHPELKLEPQNLTNCLSQKFKTLYLKKTDRMKFREMLKNDKHEISLDNWSTGSAHYEQLLEPVTSNTVCYFLDQRAFN